MGLTVLLTLAMMALLLLMVLLTVLTMPDRRLTDFFPEDVKQALQPRLDAIDRGGMTGKRLMGWVGLAVLLLAMLGVFLWAGLDGIRRGYSYGQHLLRFLVIGLGVKAFDILGLDYFLLTKTQFFQRRFPETKGCAGWQDFGYNRRQQLRQIVMILVMSFLTAALFAWLG